MNIRIASKEIVEPGKKALIEATQEFEKEFKIRGLIVTEQYYESLINLCLDKGVIIVAEEDNKIIGSIMAIINPNIFSALNELVTIVTWVHKDKRNSSAFYRMFKLYEKHFTKLKEENKIDRVLMAKLTDRTNVKYENLGFKLIEKTYERR